MSANDQTEKSQTENKAPETGGQSQQTDAGDKNLASNESEKTATPKRRVTDLEVEEAGQPARKVIFSSNAEKYGEPKESVRIGLKVIKLPPATEQLAGFEHEDAAMLVRAVRGFGWLKPKGEK